MSHNQIILIGTGGTIAGLAPNTMRANQYQAGAISIEALASSIENHEFNSLNLNDCIRNEFNKENYLNKNAYTSIVTTQFSNIDSKDMTLMHWQNLTQCVTEYLSEENVKGVLITHGTDTLEETAYWLHLTVASLKPIVMTAAMRPSNALSADGPRNLHDGISVVQSDEAWGRGVLVAFGGRIFSARDIVKASTYANDAFSAGKNGLIGWVNSNSVEFIRNPIKRHSIHSEFINSCDNFAKLSNFKIEIICCYVGMSASSIDAMIDQKVDGIILAGMGNGSLPESIIAALYRANEAGIILVRNSRIRAARVISHSQYVQLKSNSLIEKQSKSTSISIISSNNIDIFKARILLLLALSHNINQKKELQRLFDEY